MEILKHILITLSLTLVKGYTEEESTTTTEEPLSDRTCIGPNGTTTQCYESEKFCAALIGMTWDLNVTGSGYIRQDKYDSCNVPKTNDTFIQREIIQILVRTYFQFIALMVVLMINVTKTTPILDRMVSSAGTWKNSTTLSIAFARETIAILLSRWKWLQLTLAVKNIVSTSLTFKSPQLISLKIQFKILISVACYGIGGKITYCYKVCRIRKPPQFIWQKHDHEGQIDDDRIRKIY